MATVSLKDVRKSYGRHRGHPRRLDRRRRRRVRRHRRPLRLRQVDAAAHGRRPRGDHLRHHRDRRPRGERPRAARPRHRHGVPELRALPAHERLRQHGLRPEDRRHPRRRPRRPASRPPPRCSSSRPTSTASPRELSGGQRQRVAMGRALVRGPAAFLLDEPLSNLDAKLRVQMRLQIKALQREVGTTALYVTHDQVEAMTLADRLIVMNAGVAEQIDTPLAVYERPRHVFVAGFIGSPAMNILPGTVRAGRAMLPGGIPVAPASAPDGVADPRRHPPRAPRPLPAGRPRRHPGRGRRRRAARRRRLRPRPPPRRRRRLRRAPPRQRPAASRRTPHRPRRPGLRPPVRPGERPAPGRRLRRERGTLPALASVAVGPRARRCVRRCRKPPGRFPGSRSAARPHRRR